MGSGLNWGTGILSIPPLGGDTLLLLLRLEESASGAKAMGVNVFRVEEEELLLPSAEGTPFLGLQESPDVAIPLEAVSAEALVQQVLSYHLPLLPQVIRILKPPMTL